MYMITNLLQKMQNFTRNFLKIYDIIKKLG